MLNYTTLPDKELITLLKRSDHLAYTEIFKRYHYLMIIFAYKKLKDEDAAKDFVQDLFTSLWLKREFLLETGNLSAYLYVSLRNKLLDHFSHQKVADKYIDALADFLSKHPTTNTDYLVREKQLSDYIQKQIQALPAKMRQVFELSRHHHLSYKEIAKELSLSEKTVNSQMVNALNRLRTKLGLFLWILVASFTLVNILSW
jgi:RNA polymerase sigma-70 factor (family 1)